MEIVIYFYFLKGREKGEKRRNFVITRGVKMEWS